MLQVGITGGIGSGKSTVSRIFEVMGIPVYYADDAAKTLMNENPELKQAIIKHFGTDSYENNRLNRNHISSIVFDNPEKLALLNSLVHPLTIKDADNWMKRQTSPYSLKEAALIFESGSNKFLDYTIGVSAPEPLRIERTMKRDHITKELAQKKIDLQMDEHVKMRRCDFIILNDEKHSLIEQVISLNEKLLTLAKEKANG